MNFAGYNPELGASLAGFHWALGAGPSMDPRRNPNLHQGVQLVPGWMCWTPDLQPRLLLPVPLPDWHGAPASNLRDTPPLDPETLHAMNAAGFADYGVTPRMCHLNQVPYHTEAAEPDYGKYDQVPESPIGRDEEPHLYMVPKKYRKVTIKYPKFGLDDFDFKYYNKTLFAGLEPHIPNTYCNCMIQVLYFLEPVRCLLQNHLCQREFCLACELGFLFHMLDLSRGEPCQASNFLRAFRTMREVSALDLKLTDSDEQTGKARLGRLIQSWNRFIITQLHKETQRQEGPQACWGASSSPLAFSAESVIERLFGCEVEDRIVCRCGRETVRSSLTLLSSLRYLEQNSQEKAIKEHDFAEILKKSICLEERTRGWCENCKQYQPKVQIRSVRRLPDVLVVNCEVNSAKEAEFWKVQAEYAFNRAMHKEATRPTKTQEPTPPEWDLDEEGFCCVEDTPFHNPAEDLRHVWIPATLKMSVSNRKKLEISSWPEGEELSAAEEAAGASLYDLVVSVSHILDPCTSGHLVAHIKVGETYHKRKEGVTHQQWYLFNDFLVQPIDKTEAAQFDVSWKVPAILYYAKRNYHTKYDLHIKSPIDASMLLTEAPLTRNHRTFYPLTVSELPQAGDLVGLDAEFVKLNQEVVEVLSDGTKSTIRPSQMSVARITCVRSQGFNAGVAFIDDYISTHEQVIDYLTQYSGIKPGDLDVKISSKYLTSLKSTYQKLRFLIDAGVRFVGHGLQNDFRVINLLVPKDQVIDTVQLFRLPHRRLISLRFLAWYFLGLTIQGETHDSAEDAGAALLLYRRYLELSHGGNNEMRKVLRELYKKGRQLDWKVPDPDAGRDQGAAAAPSASEP